MTEKELKEKQEAMGNAALIGFVEDQIVELARTGGMSHKMSVPPSITDTDMLLSELVKRYKDALTRIEMLEKLTQGSDYVADTFSGF